ncbi:VWA domain-containing protein [Pseudoduganella lutea]|uniref:TadE/TadG family protein n=1 Tax=Pseudoduganella lutea TaxID=321985 RepID=A0A4V0Z349_9BURK|nr:TadE/TadG family type IV pilus assembly protein [Pseudoduganella lutea]QBE62203.1 TadE/TadG family protein [Pseudoduganella lutea]
MTPLLKRQRGAVAIMVALGMMVLLAVAGLAIDTGLAYLVKARLNAAVDSAALAGARAVTAGNTQSEQTASAQAAAKQFFEANIPASYLMSRPKLLSTSVVFNAGEVTIDVKADAPMPVSIMQLMGFKSLTPVASAQTVRRDLDMAFVIDTSRSLIDVGPTVRTSAKSFLNKFNVTQDRVGLVHFSSGAVMDYPIFKSARGFQRDAMLSTISGFVFDGGTSSFEGMRRARDDLNAIPPLNRSSLRVIVFFSDGAPTSFGVNLPFGTCNRPGVVDSVGVGLLRLDAQYEYVSNACTLSSQAWNTLKKLPKYYNAVDTASTEWKVQTLSPRPVVEDIGDATKFKQNVGNAARNLAEAVAAKARDDNIFVFTLGMGEGLKDKNADGETGEAVLKCMANVADGPSRCYNANKNVGMYCYAATEADLTPCFSKLASAILRISK